MDNFKLTMQAFGEVYEGMAREVYVEEGREVETMDEDGQTDSATLHELHTDPSTGVTAKRYDLSVGKFNVVAEVTEATTTRRDKTVRTMMTIAQAAASIQAMDVGQAALLTALKNMDGEGIGDLKDWVHKKAVSMGLDEMTPEEQQQAQQQQQQPDPQAEVLAAQADALKAQTGKFVADTGQSKAKTVLTLAQAHKTNIDAHMAPQQAAQDHVNNLMRGAA
jgi:hypothetical protein